ncbi:glycosyltransferase family 4 protein [Microbacterium memoriense]|uniref:D-inositol 3-phosphate glycosyltransferase n=1 Tax=Microbacterium memoriense TaxID=2978350 RepID=A0ABT2PDH1_9MICO|nr:glycosyltransferase family 4 protein [Microbacterium memoriense]MCT9002629.1 glycosyltransferase family 4 protein [Microbacterium memoriense]
MRILVYPHDLGVGGSQLNAIELAAAVRDLGHEVVVFGRRGELNGRIDELGLEFVAAPPPGKRPSPATAAALTELVRTRRIDVLHGYEWPPTLDAVLAARRGARTAVVSTVMSMAVAPFIPHSVPLIVGTEQIADTEKHRGRVRVSVIEPPVDLAYNDIRDVHGVAEFRSRFGVDDRRLTLVMVTRLAHELKLEGILTAIEVVGRLAEETGLQLIVVGDGPAREVVRARADAVNARCGAGTIVLTGQLADPRPAYAVADIAFGMGGSALRALAYGAPLVVQGERGFWRALTPETVDGFLWQGWYGVDGGGEHGVENLERELRPLLRSPRQRTRLGAFGLELVRQRFALTRAADVQTHLYADAIAHPSRSAVASETAALVRYSRYYLSKRVRRALGTESADDFNARPVAGAARVRSAG